MPKHPCLLPKGPRPAWCPCTVLCAHSDGPSAQRRSGLGAGFITAKPILLPREELRTARCRRRSIIQSPTAWADHMKSDQSAGLKDFLGAGLDRRSAGTAGARSELLQRGEHHPFQHVADDSTPGVHMDSSTPKPWPGSVTSVFTREAEAN